MQQKFSKQVQGVGGLKVLNDGLLGQEPTNTAMMNSYTNMKSELSVKEGTHQDETNSLNVTTTNKYSMKSRSNITLLPQGQHGDSSIVPQVQPSSKLTTGTNYETKN